MNYIYSGRLQPLSILNEKEILWMCNSIGDDDKIIIGIVNPNPQFIDPYDMPYSWKRFLPEYNPLSYWERHEIVAEFINRCHISHKVIATLPLPRPSTNMQRAANYLPKNRTMCLSVVQRENSIISAKELGMRSQGEVIKRIPAYDFGYKYTIVSPELICSLIAVNNDNWKQLVSPYISSYLDSLNITHRIVSRLNREDAIKTLNDLYESASSYSEKKALSSIVGKSVSGFAASLDSSEDDEESKVDFSFLFKSVEDLCSEMNRELPTLRDSAPSQFEIFSTRLATLEQLYHNISRKEDSGTSEYEALKTEFERVSKSWNNRNR